MVLGLGSRSRRGKADSLQIEFEIRLIEITPWQGLQSSRQSASLILLWHGSDKVSGNSKIVLSQGEESASGGKIRFDESFRLPVTLYRESTKKGNKSSANDMFQANCVVFSLCEANNSKGQPLGRATLDLAAYGAIEEPKRINIPLSVSRKVSTKEGLPCLLLVIDLYRANKESVAVGADEDRFKQSDSLLSTHSQSSVASDEYPSTSADEQSRESLGTELLRSDEVQDIAAFTNMSISPATFARSQVETIEIMDTAVAPGIDLQPLVLGAQESLPNSPAQETNMTAPVITRSAPQESSSSSTNCSSEALSSLTKDLLTPSVSRVSSPNVVLRSDASLEEVETDGLAVHDRLFGVELEGQKKGREAKLSLSESMSKSLESPQISLDDEVTHAIEVTDLAGLASGEHSKDDHWEADKSSQIESPQKHDAIKDIELKLERVAVESVEKLVTESSSSPSDGKQIQKPATNDLKAAISVTEKQTDVELDVKGRTELELTEDQNMKQLTIRESEIVVVQKETSALEEATIKIAQCAEIRNEKIENKSLEEKNTNFVQTEEEATAEEGRQLQIQIERLKGELRDAAAIEAAVYSVVAEHGSSCHKVHRPARRLARFYAYAFRHWNKERRASSARNSVSGLVLVARACGHDVPRLTYWWSNVVVLREVISSAFKVLPSSPRSVTVCNQSDPGRDMVAREKVNTKLSLAQHDWSEPGTFVAALERLEAWIHAKVVESVWWQALTLHMQKTSDCNLQQSDAVAEFDEEKVVYVRRIRKKFSGCEDGSARQGNMSIDIWKRAFLNSFEKLCPVRAVGVECGCLPMLAQLTMEQCIPRLDVAMFNAILRGHEDESPTDPISDPISDPCVLPISIGNLSFGSGAQLKNAIRTWSTWLTNYVRNGAVGSIVDHSGEIDEEGSVSFPLLKAIGDLLMLPKDMLADKSVREEVCPILNLLQIRKLLLSFVPDAFSPDPISPSLLAAVNEEILMEKQINGDIDESTSQGMVSAPPIIYIPPQSSSIREWVGDTSGYISFGKSSHLLRNSSLLRRSQTSDDELDELESPMNLLVLNSVGVVSGTPEHIAFPSSGNSGYFNNENYNSSAMNLMDVAGMNQRFQLLREVWTLDC